MIFAHVGENYIKKLSAVIEKQSFEVGSFEKKVFRRNIHDFQNAVTFLFEEIQQIFWHTSESS